MKRNESLTDIKKEIEQKPEKKVQDTKKTNAPAIETLMNIMSEDASEFEKRTGRPMTYSEMREMYG